MASKYTFQKDAQRFQLSKNANQNHILPRCHQEIKNQEVLVRLQGDPLLTVNGNANDAATVGIYTEVLKTLKIDLAYDPVTLLLGDAEEPVSAQQRHLHSHVCGALSTGTNCGLGPCVHRIDR